MSLPTREGKVDKADGFATMERRTIADIAGELAMEPLPADPDVHVWRFEGFEFNLRRSELKSPDGAVIALRPKAEALLRCFLKRPRELVGREELMASIWPKSVVTDDSLVQCVHELRSAFGKRGGTLVQTVPRRGYRFEAIVEPVDSTSVSWPAPRLNDRRLVVAVLLVCALGTAGAAWWWHAGTARVGIDAQVSARHVFAVMPFEAEDPALKTVAARIADHIAAELAARPGTRSIGPARTQAFRAERLAELAEQTGATYVMSGRVARGPAGQVASVEVQLIAAPGGELVGAERFDLGTDPDAGSELGQSVMNFMRGHVGARDDAVALRQGHTPNGADMVLLGWNAILRRQSLAEMSTARERFESALREDPDSLLALDGLGAIYLQQRSAGVALRPEEVAAAEKAIDKVLRSAPDDATAALLWGNLQLLEGRPDLALPSIEKANRLTPGFPNGHLLMARALMGAGRIDEVGPEAQRAVRLANLSRDAARASAALQVEAEAALMRQQDERAPELARHAVGERPDNAQAHAVLAAAEKLSGDATAALAEVARMRKLSPGLTVANFDSTRPSTEPRYLAARERLYDGLRAAGVPER